MNAVPKQIYAVDDLLATVGARTMEVVSSRRAGERVRRRGWIVRRALLVADLLGLARAVVLAALLVGGTSSGRAEWAVLLVILPAWTVVAKIYTLYDRDEERADHTTVDDV